MSFLGVMKTCGVLILRWPCIMSTSNRIPNRLNNNNDGSDLTLWRRSTLKFTNSSNVASFERNSTQTGLLTLCPFLKKIVRSETALTFVILVQLVLRINFRYPSLTS